MGEPVDVVDVEHVEVGEAEAARGLLKGPHRAIIAVVEDRAQMQRLGPGAIVQRVSKRRREVAAYLGRYAKAVARHTAQKTPKSQLAFAVAIERSGVEIPHAAV